MSSTATTEERGGSALRERLSGAISQLAAAGALIVVFVFLSFASPVFLSADNLFNIGAQTAVVAVIAIGMTLVIITAGIDLSVGSVAALSGVLGVMMMADAGLPVLVAAAGYIVLSRTRLGRYAYAMGSNLEAARLSGIPIRRYLTSVYVISGALAGLGGMIAASRVNSGQPNFGIGLELDVIAAAVIGGASLFGGQGTVVGTLIGAFLVALIRNGSVLLNINTFYQDVIIGVVIWLAVIWDQYRRRRLAAASE